MKKNLQEMEVKAINKSAILESHDGEEFSLITVAKNVLCEDGTTMQDYFDSHSEPNISTKIVNSNSMSKVGQGDNVDFSDNVMNGAYEDVVLKGKSLVNVIQGSSKDKVTLDSENATAYPVVIKPNTKYSIIAHKDCNCQTDNLIYTFDLGGATTTCSVNDTITTVTTPTTLSHQELRVKGQGLALSSVRVIEGEVTQDLPYFEGICDCKSPILSNIGETILETPFEKEFGTDAQKEFFRIVDCAEIFDNFGVGKQYTLSLDIKANKSGAARIYLQNGSGSRHNFSFDIPVTTEYVRHTKQITPTMAGDGHNFKESWLACFTTYNTGCFATIKNIRISTGEDEPYKSNILSCETYFDETTQSDKTIVLRSLPKGVCDTLNVKTGEYVQNIGEGVFNGDENWLLVDFVHDTLVEFKLNSDYKLKSYNSLICDRLVPTSQDNVERIYMFADGRVYVRILKSKATSVNDFKQYLQSDPITVQYELATPIVKQVNVEGYPYAYENGHILLESGSQEQSLTPIIEYSIVANRGGQIRSNQRMVERHQKKLDSLYAMTLVNMIDSQYKQVLMKLKSELGSEVRTWDIE